MSILVHDCPHCKSSSVAMVVAAHHSFDDRRGVVCLLCQACKLPCGASVINTTPTVHSLAAIAKTNDELQTRNIIISEFWPAPPATPIPEHLPRQVERALLQAEHNFEGKGNEDASGIMYRRAIETAIRLKFPDVGGPLKKRIETLVETSDLTPLMGDWAHEIRILGNEAAHEIDGVTRAELIAIRGFADAFLRYVFTLPEQIRMLRAGREKAK